MKLSIGKKIVLLIHWLLSAAAFMTMLSYIFWPGFVAGSEVFLYGLVGKSAADIAGWVLIAVYAVFAVLSIAFILGGKRGDDDSGFITVISDDSGKTRIAMGAIEQMIRIAVRGIAGIADLKSSIVNEMDSIAISVNVAVVSGVHIPTVTSNIQRTISNYIELNCGVSVREVSVSVNALETPEDAGKRGRKKFGKGLLGAAPAPAAIEEAPVNTASNEKPVPDAVVSETAANAQIIPEASAGDGEEA